MKTKLLAAVLALFLLVSNVKLVPVQSESAQLIRYHVYFDESINEGRFKTLQLQHYPLLAMLRRLDFTFTANQDFTFTDSIELPIEQVGTTSTRAGGTGSMTITGRANLLEGQSYTYVFEGTLTYSSQMQWIDDRPNIPPMQGTDGTIKYESTGPFKIMLTNEEKPGKSMVNYGGSSGTQLAAKSSFYQKTNIKNGTAVESVRDPDLVFTSLAFYVYTSRHVDSLPTEETEDESFSFTGSIVDYAGRPMKHMDIVITAGGRTYNGTTGATGAYAIQAEGLEELPDKYTITPFLRYKKDGREFFSLVVNLFLRDYFMNVKKDVVVSSESDLHCDFVLSKEHPKIGFAPLIGNEYLDNVTTVYHYMSQVVEFYESLDLYKEFNVPTVLVFCYDRSNSGTLYSPGTGIYIAMADMENSSPEAPHNREWHEYNHHVMYSLYGKWPEGVSDGYQVNHAGFLNDSTADSYLEGFAEFMALVTGDYYDLGNGPIYAPIANMDLYYKPWDWRGQAEELSVAAILWKLYDGVYAKEVGSSLDTLWPILKTYSKDFGEVYEKLIATHPSKQGTIDALFVSHGFFRSTQAGNGEHDNLEPFIDRNNNRRYDQGESFVDLPINEQGRIEVNYKPDAKVGYAADAGRPDRRSPLSPQGHFIKTDNQAPIYIIEYAFAEHPEFNYQVKTRNMEGHIAVVVPPSEYIATITVKPCDVSHDNPLTFSSAEFYTKYSQSVAQGSFIEHDFKITGSVVPIERLSSSLASEELPYPLETITGEIVTAAVAATPTTPEPQDKDTVQVISDPNHSKPQRNMLYVVVPVAIVIAVGVLVVVFKVKR